MLLLLVCLAFLAILAQRDGELTPSTAEGFGWVRPKITPATMPLRLLKGGTPAPPKPQQIPNPPAPPPPPPPIPPPPTQTAVAADQAALDARKQQLSRKGIGSTLLAGETGGANAPAKKSLLG
jgi:type IV secretory pathway VirB10-like protein